MARPISWSDVRGGAILTVVLLVTAAAVMKYSRLGRISGETFHLTVFLGEARGVLVGSEVWLSGQKVGKITSISFRGPAADTSERIEIRMQLQDKYRNAMRRDAVAQIRNGGTIIGAPVVYLYPGTSAAPALLAGDTIHSKPQVDLEGTTGTFGSATKELPAIMVNLKQIVGDVKGVNGSAGAFLNAPGGPGSPELARTRVEFSRLTARLSGGKGSVSADAREDVMRRAQRVMAHVDSVRALIASPNTSLGRFRRDSTLQRQVGAVRDEVAVVRTMLDESRGTAGRAMHDSALTNALGDAQREMAALFADVKKHPMKYIRF